MVGAGVKPPLRPISVSPAPPLHITGTLPDPLPSSTLQPGEDRGVDLARLGRLQTPAGGRRIALGLLGQPGQVREGGSGRQDVLEPGTWSQASVRSISPDSGGSRAWSLMTSPAMGLLECLRHLVRSSNRLAVGSGKGSV